MAKFEFPSEYSLVSNTDLLSPEFFTGREIELSVLRDVLNGVKIEALPSGNIDVFNEKYGGIFQSVEHPKWVIQGDKGIGKSALAIEYISKFRKEYDLIWWIPCSIESSIVESLRQLCQRVTEKEPENLEEPFPTELNTYLSNQKRWLLIYDGLNDPKLTKYLPSEMDGHCLLTSTFFEWTDSANVMPLSAISEKHAVELVRNYISEDDSELISKFTKLLNRNPLSIRQAIDYTLLNEYKLNDYLESQIKGNIEYSL
ncbi:hypothetical protein HOG98_02815 [bacterium]|jgi:hypothetical protein|nr:hypothetical protein [bacterium]